MASCPFKPESQQYHTCTRSCELKMITSLEEPEEECAFVVMAREMQEVTKALAAMSNMLVQS